MEDRLSDTQVKRPKHENNKKRHVRGDMEHEYLKVNLQTVPFYILITQHHIYVHFYSTLFYRQVTKEVEEEIGPIRK